jgi:hypothetical protein
LTRWHQGQQRRFSLSLAKLTEILFPGSSSIWHHAIAKEQRMESEIRARIESELEALQTARDELRVKIHLGATEVRDVWESAEKSWAHLEGRVKVLAGATQESFEDVGAAIEVLAEEIRRGYQHVRKLL